MFKLEACIRSKRQNILKQVFSYSFAYDGHHFFSHSCGFQKEEEGKEKQREDEKLTSKYIDFFYKASQTKSWALYGFNENKI